MQQTSLHLGRRGPSPALLSLYGEFTVKQLLHTPSGKVLRAAHPDYPDMPVRPEQEFDIWGVVQWNVHRM
ncbi:MAG: hypothetical protein A2061_06125 [Gallionellales bacterium GWA2_59_43]|nr:MAG: hypothetical protein A2061_06125 [Gallionellales bacterium GWA2_59_43]